MAKVLMVREIFTEVASEISLEDIKCKVQKEELSKISRIWGIPGTAKKAL
jgi:hypothetical protein